MSHERSGADAVRRSRTASPAPSISCKSSGATSSTRSKARYRTPGCRVATSPGSRMSALPISMNRPPRGRSRSERRRILLQAIEYDVHAGAVGCRGKTSARIRACVSSRYDRRRIPCRAGLPICPGWPSRTHRGPSAGQLYGCHANTARGSVYQYPLARADACERAPTRNTR